MPSWKKVITSGSDAYLNSLTVVSGVTGSLFGTASYSNQALSSSYAITASYANSLNQNVTLSGSFYISGSILNVDSIQFNTASAVTLTPGGINWDNGTGTLNVLLKGGNIDLQVGQENVVLINNGEATTLNKGEVVYVSGSQGNRPLVKRASAVNDGYSVTTLGIVAESITSGAEGFVTTFGMINNINTLGETGGAPVWLSPTVLGGWTTTKPQAPGHTVLLGYIVRVSNTVGSIFVHISNGWEIDELHNVLITNNNDTQGDLLVKSGSLWINSKQLTGSYGLTGSLSATSFTGSLFGTSSWSVNAQTASYLNTLNQNLTLNGNLILNGTASISYLNVFYESASVIFSSGSNQFGDNTNDIQTLIGTTTISGSLQVTGSVNMPSITGSLFGTSSWAQNSLTASYILQSVSASFATSASFGLTSISASFAATASSVNTLNQNVIVNGAVTASYMILSGSGGNVNRLLVVGSGSNTPLFTVQGSQGELFSITDSLSGSLFSVNDISGLPILEVFSDNTTLIGDYQDPMLITTKKVTMTKSGSFVIYSLPTSSYDTAFFDYSIKSGSNGRAGTIMAIQSGSSVNYTETTTTDFGSTSAITFSVTVSGSNMVLSGSASTGSWTTKCIIRGL